MYPVNYYSTSSGSQFNNQPAQDNRERGQSKDGGAKFPVKNRPESVKPPPLSVAPTSPGYIVAPPPPTPGYTIPPPFQHNKYKQGRSSPSQQALSVSNYSVSPTCVNKNNISPKLLYPPPRSPNMVYQPPSPSLSYFSSHSGTRQRTLIEVPRVDNTPVPRMSESDGQGLDANMRVNPLGKDPEPATQSCQLIVPESSAGRPSSARLPGHMSGGMSTPGGQMPTDQIIGEAGMAPQLGTGTCFSGTMTGQPLAGPMTGGFHYSNQAPCQSMQGHMLNGPGMSGHMVPGQIIYTGSNLSSSQLTRSQLATPSLTNPVSTGFSSSGINITKSRLDPNVRPFTPSGKLYNYFSNIEGCDTTESASYQTCDSETQSQSEDFEEGFVFNFDLDSDPLPKDPGSLLPDLDTTLEDINNNVSYIENNNIKSTINNNNNNNNLKSTNDKKVGKGEKMSGDDVSISSGVCTDTPGSTAPSPLVHDAKWQTNLAARPAFLSAPTSLIPSGFFSVNENRRENCESESRNLVSGLEQSLHKWIANQQLQLMQQQASFIDKIKRRMANGHVAPKDCHQQTQQQTNKLATSGGIFAQELSVPPEYLMSHIIGDRIRPINIRQEHTDLLFFLFYTMHGDAIQLVAASLLFERGWRFHKQQRIWLARWPGVRPEEKTEQFEKGLYQYFDMVSWKRIPGWFRLDYCHLAEKTNVPEDLKTMYTKYSEVMRGVHSACSKSIALHGFDLQGPEELDQIEGINLMNCIM